MDSLFLKDGKSTDPFEVSSSPCGFPDCSVGKASACNAGLLDSWVRKICCRRDRRPTPVFLGFPCGSAGKESTRNVGDLDLIPGLGRRERLPTPVSWPGEFHGLYNPWGLQESDTTEQLSLSLYSPGNPLPLTSPTSQQWGACSFWHAVAKNKTKQNKQTRKKISENSEFRLLPDSLLLLLLLVLFFFFF